MEKTFTTRIGKKVPKSETIRITIPKFIADDFDLKEYDELIVTIKKNP